jgi:tRNA(Arg) A34 adenosine deaminase TadA
MDAWWYFKLAAEAAERKSDSRHHRVGAVGIRSDGAIVVSQNGPSTVKNPRCHAEYRLVRKMDYYGTVYVARKSSLGFLLARPCATCRAFLRSRRVRVVYYTISNSEYGVLRL